MQCDRDDKVGARLAQVAVLVAQGLQTKQIVEKLGYTTGQVRYAQRTLARAENRQTKGRRSAAEIRAEAKSRGEDITRWRTEGVLWVEIGARIGSTEKQARNLYRFHLDRIAGKPHPRDVAPKEGAPTLRLKALITRRANTHTIAQIAVEAGVTMSVVRDTMATMYPTGAKSGPSLLDDVLAIQAAREEDKRQPPARSCWDHNLW